MERRIAKVSINSTSEEVRSRRNPRNGQNSSGGRFPLIQLPRKSEVGSGFFASSGHSKFPLIQLPRKSEALYWVSRQQVPSVSINSTSEEVRSHQQGTSPEKEQKLFPLIQLPRKSEVDLVELVENHGGQVSINSTSEEVRSAKNEDLYLDDLRTTSFH